MKILFLTRSLAVGGAERQLTVLARGLRQRGHMVSAATMYGGGCRLEKQLIAGDVRVICFDKNGRWDVIPFIYRLINIIRREKPEILHSYITVPNIISVLIKPLFPDIVLVWGLRHGFIDLKQYDWLRSLTDKLECFLSKWPNAMIANSHSGKLYAVKRGFPQDRIRVIPNGVDTGRFVRDVSGAEKVRREWGVEDQETLIGIVARFDPSKDHSNYLRAAAILSKKMDDVRFVCVGRGSSERRAQLAAECSQLGLSDRVIWAGERQDMPAVYSALDVCCSSSYGEGTSNAVAEAMACEVPCVATDAGDSAIIVGDLGIVVPPRDPDKLAAGLTALLETPPSKQAMRTQIVQNFSVESLINRTEAELFAVLRSH